MVDTASFFFIRHGVTEWNKLGLCQGLTDIPLNEEGRNKSSEFSKRAQKIHFPIIYSSPLSRALQTAEIIQTNQLHNPEIVQIPEFSERGFGDLEGISSEEMYALERKEEDDSSFLPGQKVETQANLQKRIFEGLNKCLKVNRGSSPLIVSHGRLFLSLCDVLNQPLIRQLENLSLVGFIFKNGIWTSNIVEL